MLDLNSPLWGEIHSSFGGPNVHYADLVREIRKGNESVYPELSEVICHQFSVGEIAYVVVPHLADIAKKASVNDRVWPLSLIGLVEASRQAYSQSAAKIRDEWCEEYNSAISDALLLTANALKRHQWEPGDSQELIAVIAALQGHANLAIHLFLHGGNTKLACPQCGEPIEFGEAS